MRKAVEYITELGMTALVMGVWFAFCVAVTPHARELAFTKLGLI